MRDFPMRAFIENGSEIEKLSYSPDNIIGKLSNGYLLGYICTLDALDSA